MTTPAPDFRALCAELSSVVYEYCVLHEGLDHLQPLVTRARAALATPPPKPPTDQEEVEELVADLRAMATHAGLACQPGDFKILTRAANMLQQIGEQEAGR
jgi:hypothetical protein